MSWTKNGTIYSKRKRIAHIKNRTEATRIPPIDDIYGQHTKREDHGRITRELVDQVFFSSFPTRDASKVLSAFSMNSKNIQNMKESGSLGAIIEMLRRHDYKSDSSSTHVCDLVRSLNILTEDATVQRRILSNPHAVPCILELCVHSSGQIQAMTFQVIDRLCKAKDGMETLLQHNIFDYFMSESMLSRPTTMMSIRHSTANLINRMGQSNPDQFPVEKMDAVMMVRGERAVDGYIEMQLINGLLAHLNWLTAQNRNIEKPFSILVHFINEIKNESFEDLEHLLQILRVLALVSKSISIVNYLMSRDLNVALQYVVRTDFELWRRSYGTTSRPASSKSTHRPRSSSSRPTTAGARVALDAILKPVSNMSKMDEVNFKMTRLALQIYENVLNLSLDTIADIVSSGLTSGLLFRVGKGKYIDKRFNKLVTHFLTLLLIRVALLQPSYSRPMSVIEMAPRPREYARTGVKAARSTLRPQALATDVRTISNTLHAQGVTNLFVQCLVEGDDIELVGDAVSSLASMSFAVIKPDIMSESVVGRIAFYALSRQDCFFSGLSLVCDAILVKKEEYFENFCEIMICDFKVINILIRALKLSGWVFHMKSKVFWAIARLSHSPSFRDRLRKARGISVTIYELDVRKKLQRANRRNRKVEIDDDDEYTDMLFTNLKLDWAATRIQALYRASRTRQITKKSIYVLGKRFSNFNGMLRGTSASMHAEEEAMAAVLIANKTWTEGSYDSDTEEAAVMMG